MSVLSTRIDQQLAQVLQALNNAQLTDAQRRQLEDQAEGLVNRGASQAVANYLNTGTSAPAPKVTAQPDAGLAQRLSTALGNQQTTGTAGTALSPDQYVAELRAIQALGNTPEAAQRLAALSQQGAYMGLGLTSEQAAENVRAVAAGQEPALMPSTAQREVDIGRAETLATDWTGVGAPTTGTPTTTYKVQPVTGTPDTDLAQRLSAALQTQQVNLPAYQRQAIPQTDLSALGAAGPQTPITMPALTQVQAPRTDLSALQARAGQVPEMKLPTYQQQAPSAVDLSALKQAGPQTAITAPAYTPPSTEQLRTGISAMPSITAPTATTPQAFMSEDVQKAIAAQGQGQAPAPMQAQFGTPEQFGQYVAQTQQMLQPYTDAQKTAATAAFNEAMQKLGGQWAARGMLASGAAAGAQQQAAQGFGVQMGLLEAQQLEQAINTALQAGQLSTTEAQAIWNQAMTGTQFGQQQATTQAQLLQQALAQQEQQRLAEQGLGLNVQQAQAAQEQARMAALQSALGLETQQAQFGANLGLETQQTEMQRQQALADNLARTLGMEVAQRQWGQEFTRAQLNDIFQQAVTSQQLSEQQRQAAINALTQLAQMDIQQGQFGAELGAQQQQFGANLSLAVQQAEAQRQQQLASNLAQKMGMQIQQAQWGAEFGFAQEKEIFNQAVTSQQLDYQERQAAQDALLKLTQMEIQQQQFGQQFGLEQAGVTGAYQGQPTLQAQQLQAALQAQQWDQQMDAWQAELKMDEAEFDRWLKTETLNLDKAKYKTDAEYKAHLQKMGLTEAQGTMATNGYMSQILAMGSAEAAFQYIVQNADAIVNDGANVTTILQNLKYKWPEFYATSGGAITSDAIKNLFGTEP